MAPEDDLSSDDIKRVFGANVRRAREAIDWSQEQLATASKLYRQRIGQIESGDANLTLDTAQKIASALGKTLSELVRRRP